MSLEIYEIRYDTGMAVTMAQPNRRSNLRKFGNPKNKNVSIVFLKFSKFQFSN